MRRWVSECVWASACAANYEYPSADGKSSSYSHTSITEPLTWKTHIETNMFAHAHSLWKHQWGLMTVGDKRKAKRGMRGQNNEMQRAGGARKRYLKGWGQAEAMEEVCVCILCACARVGPCLCVSVKEIEGVCVCVQCSDLFLQSLEQPQQKASLSWISVYTGWTWKGECEGK